MQSKKLFFGVPFIFVLVILAVNSQVFSAAERMIEPEMRSVLMQSIIDEYDRVYKDSNELIKKLNIESIRKDQLMNEYQRSRRNFDIYTKLDNSNPGKLSYLSAELATFKSIYEDLKRLMKFQYSQTSAVPVRPYAFVPAVLQQAPIRIDEFNRVFDRIDDLMNQSIAINYECGDDSSKMELKKFIDDFQPYANQKISSHDFPAKVKGKLGLMNTMNDFLARIQIINDRLIECQKTKTRGTSRQTPEPAAVDISSQAQPKEYLVPTSQDQLLESLKLDLKKYVNNPEGTNLNWCDCGNAPMDKRLELSARIAFDVKTKFIKNDILNITSFATGGLVNGAAQLLQEFIFIDALMRVWPKDKGITINLALIGPELDNDQARILWHELNELNEQRIYNKNVAINISIYATHRDYIEAVLRSPSLRSDILVSVDYHGITVLSQASSNAANCIEISAPFSVGGPPVWLPIMTLAFVDAASLKFRQAIQHFLLYYRSQETLGFKVQSLGYKGAQEWIEELRLNIRNFLPKVVKEFLELRPGRRIDFLVTRMAEKLRTLYNEKNYQIAPCMLFDLAFKELVAHTLKPQGLVYSLQKDIFLPQQFQDIMQNPNPKFSGEGEYHQLPIK